MDNMNLLDYPSPEILLSELTMTVEDVTNDLNALDITKASGPDEIPAHLLKACSNEIAPSLCSLFDRPLETACLLLEWKMANVTALHKKDSLEPASNTSHHNPRTWFSTHPLVHHSTPRSSPLNITDVYVHNCSNKNRMNASLFSPYLRNLPHYAGSFWLAPHILITANHPLATCSVQDFLCLYQDICLQQNQHTKICDELTTLSPWKITAQ